MVPLDIESSNLLIVLFPLLGFVLYQLAWSAFVATLGKQETWWNRYRAAAKLFTGPSTLLVMAGALVLVPLANKLTAAHRLPNVGLSILFLLLVVLAIRWLWTGVQGAVGWHTPPGGDWWQTFRGSTWRESWRVMSNTRIGLGMLKAIAGAIVFILLGAGLEPR